MKAVVIADFNMDPAVHDVAPPRPGDGEVLVDVQCASVNGMDALTWAGAIKDMMPYKLPITLGRDFSGTVAGHGPGVTGYDIGDAVFGVLMTMPLHDGTFAEQVAVPVRSMARRPESLDPTVAGALGLAGTAAKTAIDALAPAAGESVLICGATGGVGAIAVQLATLRGASVIATATPDEAAFVRDLGADVTVDSRDDLVSAVRRLRPDGVDAALHAAGDGAALADLVVPGGRWASTLGVGPDQLVGRNIQATAVMAIPTTDTLDELAAAATDGRLRLPISKTYTIDQVTDAMKDFASGSLGKISVTIL
jgi:NADPH:quinone reductase-like Zn-dependent oxidoreductase